MQTMTYIQIQCTTSCHAAGDDDDDDDDGGGDHSKY